MVSIPKMLYNAEKPGSIILACFKILLFQNISLFVSVEWKYRTAGKEVWEYEARQESNWNLSALTDYLTGGHVTAALNCITYYIGNSILHIRSVSVTVKSIYTENNIMHLVLLALKYYL
jgi:hypothetical protein